MLGQRSFDLMENFEGENFEGKLFIFIFIEDRKLSEDEFFLNQQKCSYVCAHGLS